jgi:DNA-binding MarR family transcriptional regulator
MPSGSGSLTAGSVSLRPLAADIVNRGERITMVKDRGQRLPGSPTRLPGLPAGLLDNERTQTANLLHSAALRLLRRARTADAGMDLDGPRASALSVLVFGGPLPLSRLAQIEQVSPPAMTKTVTALEAAGLARRERSRDDGRVVLVSATPAGRALLERGRAARVRAVERLIADLPERDRRTLRRAAELIARVL